MSFKSEMTYPRVEVPPGIKLTRLATFKKAGLTEAEAADLLTIEHLEHNEMPPSPEGKERKAEYLKKMKEAK